MTGRERLFFEKLRSDLYAQNGMNAELQVDIRWGGWLSRKASFVEEYSVCSIYKS